MDKPSVNVNPRPVIKKRKYSRGGCVECKRRKMKCDENKPHCRNCTRLNKLCVYLDKEPYRIVYDADHDTKDPSISKSRRAPLLPTASSSEISSPTLSTSVSSHPSAIPQTANKGLALAAAAPFLASHGTHLALLGPHTASAHAMAIPPAPPHTQHVQHLLHIHPSIPMIPTALAAQAQSPVGVAPVGIHLGVARANSASDSALHALHQPLQPLLQHQQHPQLLQQTLLQQLLQPLLQQHQQTLLQQFPPDNLSQLHSLDYTHPAALRTSPRVRGFQPASSPQLHSIHNGLLQNTSTFAHPKPFPKTYPSPLAHNVPYKVTDPDPPSDSPGVHLNGGSGIGALATTTANSCLDVPKTNSFRNTIQDILSPSDSSPHEMTAPTSEDFRNMQEVFDEASIFVHDLNDLVFLDSADFISPQGANSHGLKPRKPTGKPLELLTESAIDRLEGEPVAYNHSDNGNHGFDSINGSAHFGNVESTDTSNRAAEAAGDTTGNQAFNKNVDAVSELSGTSETYEKHTFQLDEFTNHIGQYTIRNESVSSTTPLDIYRKSRVVRQDFEISNSELIQQTIQQHRLSGPHVTYLQILTDTELSYHLYPFASSVECNEVVHILLEYLNNCPYLLALLLAISATFQYNQTGKPVHDLSRQKYISACLTLLSREFNTAGSVKKNTKLGNSIERLLLTVLVLTSNFTATSANPKSTHAQGSRENEDKILTSWKTHLLGAKDLLISYSSARSQAKPPAKSYGESSGLALAKIWFFAIECLAGLWTPLGGSLAKKKKSDNTGNDDESRKSSTDSEDENVHSKTRIFTDTGYFDYKSNPGYHDTLVKAGLLTVLDNTEFNLYLGFTVEVVHLHQEFIRCLDDIRRSKEFFNVSANSILLLLSLINSAKQVTIIPDVQLEKAYIIPINSKAHPDYNRLDKVTLPAAAYAKEISSDGLTTTYYSWLDVSQQIRIDGAYLRILSLVNFLGLQCTHPLIVELRDRIAGNMFFIKPKPALAGESIVAESENFYLPTDLFDVRCIMIQSIIRLCIQFTVEDIDFERLQLFFEGLVKLGNGSALSSLRLAKRERERMANGGVLGDLDVEDAYNEDELITFS